MCSSDLFPSHDRCFGEVLPEAELKVLSVLIKYSNGGCIGLGLEVVKEYRKEAGVTESNFSTCVHRLVVHLHLIFVDTF